MQKYKSLIAVTIFVALFVTGCSPTPTPVTPSPSKTVSAGDSCQTLGSQIKTADSYLECRYTSGETLAYVSLTGDSSAPITTAGLSSIEVCKIVDQRPFGVNGGGGTGQNTSFPLINNAIASSGNIRVGIIPIDFEDSPGQQSIEATIGDDLSQLSEWLQFTTNGKTTYEFITHDQWLRMPLPAMYYNWTHPFVNPDGSLRYDDEQFQTDDQMATQIFTEAEKFYDLNSLDYIWVVTPPSATSVNWSAQGNPRFVQTATNSYNLHFFSLASFLWNEQGKRLPIYAIMLHEMLHAHGLAQHAPGNGVPLHIGSSGTVMGAWDSFLLGWRSNEQFACVDGTSPLNVELSLTPLDHNSSGYKAALIKLSETEVIVVESRRNGPFTLNGSEGTAGIMAYTVDSSKPSLRFDNDFSREQDYFSHFLQIENPHSSNFSFGDAFIAYSQNPINYAQDKVAIIGDSFAHKGLRITVTQSGDYDTIQISKE